VAYLEEYKEGIVGYPDDLVGIFGFDEPDARYEGPGWNQSEENEDWYMLVQHYADECRSTISDDILPFGTFLDRWDTHDTDENFYEVTIPHFCGELEYPVFDRYPCRYSWSGGIPDRTYPDQVEFEEIIGATDLLPSGSVDYDAYAGSDEIFSVDEDGYFHVYSFANVTSHTDTLEIDEAYSFQLPASLREDPIWAASDFRAMDVGDRSANEHLLNGAVVFLNRYDEEDNAVFFYDDDESEIECFEDDIRMPASGFMENLLACVGEWSYPVHHADKEARRGGLIGFGEVRILVCSRYINLDTATYRARVFGWDGSGFVNVTGGDGTLTLDVAPRSAYWGIFWPTYTWWNAAVSDDQSGFLVFQTDGDYQVIYETVEDHSVIWEASSVYENAFAPDGRTFLARRSFGFRSFTAGMDYLCHPEGTASVNQARLEFISGPGNDPEEGLCDTISSEAFTLPGGYVFDDLNDATCWRPLQYVYDETLLLSFDNGSSQSVIYSATDRLTFERGTSMEISFGANPSVFFTASTDNPPLLATPRVYSVRRPYRTPMIFDPNPPNAPDRMELRECDIDVPNSDDLLADQHVALDRMMEWGIDSTARDNCLIPNLRCEGRHQDGQLTFYASEDTLLYLMTTALVHGCRGIHLRALDFTMMCGNGGDTAPIGTYRSPALLLDWGPSVETTNTDMLTRIHGVVRMLTGEGTSNPDFLGALIDDDWSILDTDDVYNAEWNGYGYDEVLDNEDLNFISLKSDSTGDILLLVVNDSSEALWNEDENWVYFESEPPYNYDVQCIAGYGAPDQDLYALAISFYEMPPYTASLYLLEHT
jgi:hypothetical protein